MFKNTYTKTSIMVHCTNCIPDNNYDIYCVSEYVTGEKDYYDYVRVSINEVTFFMTPSQYETLKRKIVDLKKEG